MPDPIQLHNTLSRKTEAFSPHNPKGVTLYTCGPTVYDYAHIGNLRAFVFYDTLRRTLEAVGYPVRHVMNITDVGHLVTDEDESVLSEDKFEKGAKRDGKTVWQVAEQYTDAFKRDMNALNILPPNVNPKREKSLEATDAYARATDFIPEQIELIEKLLANGFAYVTPQAIYFDILKLPDYGKLTGQNLRDKEVGARDDVVTDDAKHHPYDFAVWFFTVGHYKDHTMRWPSPWGDGFPGWHVECSAIIHAMLSDPIDIHTGGVDHIGTHHTNEMAQTEGAYGHDLSAFWLHNEHLLVDGTKMAKSKGNFYTLHDLIEKGCHPLALRVLILQAHYRSQLNFTLESLDAAQTTLLNLYAWADLKHQTNLAEVRLPDTAIKDFLQSVITSLADDLSTTGALAELFGFISTLAPGMTLSIEDFEELTTTLDKLLGLSLSGRPDITEEQKDLIAQRESAREDKKWSEADKIRKSLARHKLDISDTPNGPRWRRNTL
ncbi:MAG TPA: cysteine--tRNA ligase [Candidatus Saccharimonadia bacterium]|nr:cysteine--tRNA ligase [Candidatus Saccharimonadia bacterium]